MFDQFLFQTGSMGPVGPGCSVLELQNSLRGRLSVYVDPEVGLVDLLQFQRRCMCRVKTDGRYIE